jgi:hypothetical protein
LRPIKRNSTSTSVACSIENFDTINNINFLQKEKGNETIKSYQTIEFSNKHNYDLLTAGKNTKNMSNNKN